MAIVSNHRPALGVGFTSMMPGQMTHERRPTAFVGGRIFTGDSQMLLIGSVLVEGDRIVAIDHAGDRSGFPEETRIIDITGKTLLPGFIDSHLHLMSFGASLREINARYPAVRTVEELATEIARRAETTPEGSWIRGRGLDYRKFAEGRMPSRWDIDWASPRHPVAIIHMSGHFALVNSKALKLAGISDDVPNPKGGAFVRDDHGRITGMLLDNAVQSVLPAAVNVGNHGPTHNAFSASVEDLVENLERASQACAQAGITCVVDPQVTSRDMPAYLRAARDGRLHVRVICLYLSNHLADLRRLGIAGPIGDENLRIGGLKVYCDGSLIGGTAAFSEPYENAPETSGSTFWTSDELDHLIWEAHEFNLQVGVHAQGDRAIAMTIESFASALRRRPRDNHRHRIEHCGYATDTQLELIAKLGLVPVSQPRYLVEVGDNFVENIGALRTRHLIRLRSQLDLGIPIVLSTDAPVVSVRPLDTIYAACTRRSATGQDLGSSERITVEEAIRGYTMNAAQVIFRERDLGSITVGKAADLTLVGGNLLESDIEHVPQLPIEMTMLGGQVAYMRDGLGLTDS